MAEPQYVSLAEVRDLLSAEAEKRELLPSQKAALNHAATVCPLSQDEANEIVDKVMALDFMADLPVSIAYKVADLRPRYSNDVRAIFQKERIALDAGMIQSIIDIVDSY